MAARTDHKSVIDYIAAQPLPARPVLKDVRATIRKALPRATEGISYQIPAYKLDGHIVLYFASFQRHYALYPASARVVGALKKELTGILHGKATLRFPLTEVVPMRLITRIARLRAIEVTEPEKTRAAGRRASRKAKPKTRRKPAQKR